MKRINPLLFCCICLSLISLYGMDDWQAVSKPKGRRNPAVSRQKSAPPPATTEDLQSAAKTSSLPKPDISNPEIAKLVTVTAPMSKQVQSLVKHVTILQQICLDSKAMLLMQEKKLIALEELQRMQAEQLAKQTELIATLLAPREQKVLQAEAPPSRLALWRTKNEDEDLDDAFLMDLHNKITFGLDEDDAE